MPIFLHGLKLENYRSIGKPEQRCDNFHDFNFFVGQNNSGKSNILRFISDYLPLQDRRQTARPRPTELVEYHNQTPDNQIRCSIAITWDQFSKSALSSVGANARGAMELLELLRPFIDQMGFVWLETPIPHEGSFKLTLKQNIDRALSWTQWGSALNIFAQRQGGQQHMWPPETLLALTKSQDPHMPNSLMIPAVRQVGKRDEKFDDFSGRGIIDALAELQSPDHDARDDREKFDKINDFLSAVTDTPNSYIEIPHNRRHILVHMNDRVLPLSSIGTGIHEVIMLATFCTINSNNIVCMEEPELHLHPLLQKKLVKYLRDNTDNQYFIATHSPSFIDTAGASIMCDSSRILRGYRNLNCQTSALMHAAILDARRQI